MVSLRLFYLILIALNIVINVNAIDLTIVNYNVKDLYPGFHQIKKINGIDTDLEDLEYTPLENKDVRKRYCEEKMKRMLAKPEMQGEDKKGLIDFLNKFCLENNWGPSDADSKIEKLAEIIKSHNHTRPIKNDDTPLYPLTAPDIVAITEITTPEMAQKLTSALGYNEKEYLITDGEDIRGINQALIFNSTKLELTASHDFKVPSLNDESLRNILYARFLVKDVKDQINKKYLNIFVVHAPASYHTKELKEYFFNQLIDILNKQSIATDEMILLTGDFNTSSADDYEKQFNLALEKRDFFDVRSHTTNDNFWKKQRDHISGSHYFSSKKTWSFLDHFYIFLNKASGNLSDIVSHFDVIVTRSNSFWDSANKVRRPSRNISDHYPITSILSI